MVILYSHKAISHMAIEPYGSLVGGSNIVVSKAAEEIVIDSPEQDWPAGLAE